MIFSVSWLHTHMKIHVHHSSAETAVFHHFPCKREREQMLGTLFLFIWCHSCFHNEIRLQQVAFPAAAPSKKSIFLNHKFCNNTAIISHSSVCCIHTASIYGCFSAKKQFVFNMICNANPKSVLKSYRKYCRK